MSNLIYKPIDSFVSTRQENQNFITLNGSGLTYTLCDRTNLSSKGANYFVSFKLPYQRDAFSSGSTLSLANPELQQLNVDKMLFSPIPRGLYDELLDGRTITFTVPQYSGNTGISAVTVVSSTYVTLQKSQNNALIGKNIAFLFSDSINKPYSGASNGGTQNHATATTWNTTSVFNRPPAVPYFILQAPDINTDQRPNNTINYAINMPPNYPTNTNLGYNYDIPVGFVALDRGFLVLTHPSLVNNVPFEQGINLMSNTSNFGPTSATTNVYFSAVSTSQLSFSEINVSYLTSVVCLALPAEFYFTNNPSWPVAQNLIEEQNSTNGYTPVYPTEIGLYNINNELIAVAKLDRPIQKTYTNVITFNLNINV